MIDKLQVKNRQEVQNRLPEIEHIDGQTRIEVERAFVRDIPPEFWIVRASENHHAPDERGLGGTWLHTKRVFFAFTVLESTFRELGTITSYESNCARAACLLHDGFKYGRYPELVDTDETDGHEYANGVLEKIPSHTQTNHDVLMADYVRSETNLPEEVAHAIECHGGSTSWGSHDGPSPDNDMTLAVHLADLIASNSEYRLPVLDPHSALEHNIDDLPSVESKDLSTSDS